MTRKSVLMGTGTLLLLAGGVAATLAGLVLREPGFYGRVALPPGPEREQHSRAFKAEFSAFLNDLQERREWDATFTQDQLNSFFAEDFITSEFDKRILPEGISDPRIALDADRLRLAFRYHVGRWSTVIAIDLRVWLAAAESNVIALELQGVRAGSLPVSSQLLLERLSEAADRNNLKLSWYRHKGNPVALLRFPGDQSRSTTVLLDRLDLYPGKIVLHGQSVEPSVAASPPARPEGP